MLDENVKPHTILCVGGPSGIGKTTLISQMMGRYPEQLETIVSVTTRPPRPNEVDGVDYHFLTKEQFVEKEANSEFMETTFIHNNYYGTYKEDFCSDKDIIIPVDYVGYLQISALYPKEAMGVWLVPYNLDQLITTFEKRCANDPNMTPEKIRSRKSHMVKEILQKYYIPYTIQVDSNNYNKALEDLDCLYRSSKLRSYNFY